MEKSQVNTQKRGPGANTVILCPLKRLCCIILAVVISAAGLCLPVLAASGCRSGHSYARYFNTVHNEGLYTDYCTKCGYIKIHRCQYPLRFMTVGKTYSYTEPRASSTPRLLSNSARINVNVVGRTRNENGEHWLLLDNETYIPADSVAFNFDHYAENAVKNVSNTVSQMLGMAMTFRRGGNYDVKKDELLGNTYLYKLYLSGQVLSEQYTGEQIGNMMYGYGSAAKGFSYDEAVDYAELAAEGKDTLEDKFSIFLGYTYRKNGAWYRDISDQYVGKTIAIKSVEAGKYVSSDTDQAVQGINAVANRDSVGTWELFTVTEGGAGSIGFHSKGNSNYLSARVDENEKDAYIQAAYGHNYSEPQLWESFYILEWGGDQYILSQANWRWVQAARDESGNPIKAYADVPSTWERFQLETVNNSSAGSGTTTGSANGGTAGTVTGGNSSGGNTSVTTVVSQHFWGSDYNEGHYEGEMSNGRPNGHGKLSYEDFEDGKYYSIWMNGVECKAKYYEGDFRDGWRYGAGKVVYEGGWVQEGTFYGRWIAGQRCFEGRLWHQDGVHYLEGSQTVRSNGEEADWSWNTKDWQSTAKIKTYQVSYHANGGSGAPSAQEKTQGVSLSLSRAVPTRDGYSFLGWAESSAATSPAYSAGGSFTQNADTVLYAVWKKANRSAAVMKAYLEGETTNAYTNKDVLFIEYHIKGYTTGEAWLTFEDAITGERVYYYGPVASEAKTSVIPEYILTPGRTYRIYFSENNGKGHQIGNSCIIYTYPQSTEGAGGQHIADRAFLYSTPSEWARESILYAYQSGLVPEYMLKDFSATTTRLDFVRLAYNVIEEHCGQMQEILYEHGVVADLNVGPKLIFGDIPENGGYDGYDRYRVAALNALGIINGVGGNKFEPDRAITREEAATLLNRAYSFMCWGEVKYNTYDSSFDHLYSDNDEISDWAFYDVYNMRKVDVMNGVGNNLFAPKDRYSCEQSIVTFIRLLNCSGH